MQLRFNLFDVQKLPRPLVACRVMGQIFLQETVHTSEPLSGHITAKTNYVACFILDFCH